MTKFVTHLNYTFLFTITQCIKCYYDILQVQPPGLIAFTLYISIHGLSQLRNGLHIVPACLISFANARSNGTHSISGCG